MLESSSASRLAKPKSESFVSLASFRRMLSLEKVKHKKKEKEDLNSTHFDIKWTLQLDIPMTHLNAHVKVVDRLRHLSEPDHRQVLFDCLVLLQVAVQVAIRAVLHKYEDQWEEKRKK